jgi:hypothetical protein
MSLQLRKCLPDHFTSDGTKYAWHLSVSASTLKAEDYIEHNNKQVCVDAICWNTSITFNRVVALLK